MTGSSTALGHRRIGLISGPPSLTTTHDRVSGFHRGLREAGIAGPDELVRVGDFTRDGVAGFDDIPIAADVWPPLSTVRVPLVELGVQAANLALELQTAGFRLEKLPTSVVLRGSTGPAKART
jgi:LacI family transcriptional regulator